MKLRLGAFAALCAAAVAATPASADDESYFTGPFAGFIGGYAVGNAVYTFNTDGYYNTAAGQSISIPVAGPPSGGIIGYNWRNAEGVIYGFEYSLYPAIGGVSHAGAANPLVAGQTFDLKGHWFSAFTPRVGMDWGRVMVFAQGGPAIGHLIAIARDNPNDLYNARRGIVPGLAIGTGFEIAVSKRFSIGAGYQLLALFPLAQAGESQDSNTNAFAGPATATDHRIQFTSHSAMVRVIYRFADAPGGNAGHAPDRPSFDWSGLYLGAFGGSIWQLGGTAGYNIVLDRYVLGISGQVSAVNLIQSPAYPLAFRADANARAGMLVNDNVLLYGETGVGYTNFAVNGGVLVHFGAGMEIAVSERTTLFGETRVVFNFAGWQEGNVLAGVNFYPRRR